MRWRLKLPNEKEPVLVELVEIIEPATYRFRIDGKEVVELKNPQNYPFSILTEDFKLNLESWNSESWRATLHSEIYEITPLRFGGSDSTHQSEIKTQMPGRVLKLLVKKGAQVKPQEPLLILEAMKMENEVRSPAAATIDEILVGEGQGLEAGAVLLRLKPLA